MTKITISEAARRVGIARSTLLRHIKNGKISKVIGKDGKPSVDTSELLRVYGDLKVPDKDDTAATLQKNRSMIQFDTDTRYTEKDIEIATLRTELKAALERSDEFKEERDEWRGVAKKGQALLTDAGQGRPRQGLWARVFGKGARYPQLRLLLENSSLSDERNRYGNVLHAIEYHRTAENRTLEAR